MAPAVFRQGAYRFFFFSREETSMDSVRDPAAFPLVASR
jgi:hypothetical protein